EPHAFMRQEEPRNPRHELRSLPVRETVYHVEGIVQALGRSEDARDDEVASQPAHQATTSCLRPIHRPYRSHLRPQPTHVTATRPVWSKVARSTPTTLQEHASPCGRFPTSSSRVIGSADVDVAIMMSPVVVERNVDRRRDAGPFGKRVKLSSGAAR